MSKRAMTRTMKGTTWRRLALAGAILTLGAVSVAPAHAQFWEDSYPRRQQNDSFSFFGGDRGWFFDDRGRAQPRRAMPRAVQPVDSAKAPPPRKIEAPANSTVLVIGDSFADWLAYGLEEAFADPPEFSIVRKIKAASGLVRYEVRSDTQEWSQAIKETLANEKPNAIVIMLGLNDRQALRDRPPARPAAAPRNAEQPGQTPAQVQPASTPAAAGPDAVAGAPSPPEPAPPPAAAAPEPPPRAATGASYEFRTDKWGELYGKRIDDMIAALKSKGVPVVWVGVPSIRGTRSTSDLNYLDELFRAHAEKAGIPYVDIWDGFVDEGGRFAVQGPDFEGQIRRLRTADGIHFTRAGAVKLAHYVERELRRVMSNHVMPVAMPAPEEQSPAKPGVAGPGARPAIGPVVPLNAAVGGEGSDLLGGGNHPMAAKSDPVALRVLGRGDAIAAPSGRADDFAWPRQGPAANGASDAKTAPAGTAAAAPAAANPEAVSYPAIVPGAAKTPAGGKAEGKKNSEAKAQGATEPAAAHPHPHRARVDLDNPPRPPMPIGPGAVNSR